MNMTKYTRPPVQPEAAKPSGGKRIKAKADDSLIEEILKAAGLERLD